MRVLFKNIVMLQKVTYNFIMCMYKKTEPNSTISFILDLKKQVNVRIFVMEILKYWICTFMNNVLVNDIFIYF